ncbi:MAG: hypothetical protein HZC42_05880 [Candidatus Eisenbacteria bacterium]|nr:hypothetical protein [Candidatus Eisenbacteria bacterium]
MEAITQTTPGVWNGVEMVFMLHAQCTFLRTDPSTQSNCEFSYPWGEYGGCPCRLR